MLCAVSYKKPAGIPSGPWALLPCKSAKSLATPSTGISSTAIVTKGKTPRSDKVEVFLLMNTNTNYWLKNFIYLWRGNGDLVTLGLYILEVEIKMSDR